MKGSTLQNSSSKDVYLPSNYHGQLYLIHINFSLIPGAQRHEAKLKTLVEMAMELPVRRLYDLSGEPNWNDEVKIGINSTSRNFAFAEVVD